MTKFYITIEQAHAMVDALDHCISNDATRFYLHGLHIENSERCGLFAVATDGHRLGSIKLSPIMCDAVTPDRLVADFNFTMPLHAVDWINGLPRKFAAPHLLTFEVEHEGEHALQAGKVKLSLFPTSMSAEFNLIDGNFPDWRRVVPSVATPSTCFDAVYLKQMAAAMKKVSRERNQQFTISITDIGAPAVISGVEGLHYVLMPMREYAEEFRTNAHVPAPAIEPAPDYSDNQEEVAAVA